MPARRARSCRAADEERGDAHTAAHQERRGAFRAAQLVGGHRAQISAERREVEGDVADGGAGVDVDQHAPGPGLGGERGDRGLEGADLVVRELDGEERGVGPQRREDLLGREAALTVHADDRHVGVGAAARLEDGGVLDRRGDHVGSRPVRRAGHGAVHGGVDRLRAGRGEHDLAGSGAEQPGDGLPGVLDGDPGRPSVAVHPARVGRVAAQVGEHRLERRGAQRRGGGVVEVGPGHGRAQTRATQWSLPSGRLASKCGEVSPYRPASIPRIMPRSSAHTTWG